MNTYGLLILGAGNSSRLGQPKQLLRYKNESLIRHMAREAIAAINAPVMVVTGANAPLIEAELQDLPLTIIRNEQWAAGMGSSISKGMSAMVKAHPGLQGVIIMVCDQPFVNAVLLQQLITLQQTSGKGLIACFYENTAGTPVLFSQPYFDALIVMEGQTGAKSILQHYTDDLVLLPFPPGALDIDTIEDYQRLLDA